MDEDDDDDFDGSLKRAMAAQKRYVFGKRSGHKKRARKPTKKEAGAARAKPLQRFLKKYGYTTLDLYAELGRRGNRALMAKLTAEERKRNSLNANAHLAIKRQFCDHSKHPPKLRKGGKHPGMWTCPTCHKVVPAPVRDEELVL